MGRFFFVQYISYQDQTACISVSTILFTLVFNPFHVPCPLQFSGFALPFQYSMQNSCYFHAKSTGKKSCDFRTSTFISMGGINVSLTV